LLSYLVNQLKHEEISILQAKDDGFISFEMIFILEQVNKKASQIKENEREKER
jgi:hypothetical protein